MGTACCRRCGRGYGGGLISARGVAAFPAPLASPRAHLAVGGDASGARGGAAAPFHGAVIRVIPFAPSVSTVLFKGLHFLRQRCEVPMFPNNHGHVLRRTAKARGRGGQAEGRPTLQCPPSARWRLL